MKKYTDRERFDALNRHRDSFSINSGGGFTLITQHVNCVSVEDFADTIIHTENFIKTYGDSVGISHSSSKLYYKRKEIFFNENRILTDEEHDICVKEEREYQNVVRDLTYKSRVQQELSIKFPSLTIEIGEGNRVIVDGHMIKGIIISHYQEKLHDLSMESISQEIKIQYLDKIK